RIVRNCPMTGNSDVPNLDDFMPSVVVQFDSVTGKYDWVTPFDVASCYVPFGGAQITTAMVLGGAAAMPEGGALVWGHYSGKQLPAMGTIHPAGDWWRDPGFLARLGPDGGVVQEIELQLYARQPPVATVSPLGQLFLCGEFWHEWSWGNWKMVHDQEMVDT